MANTLIDEQLLDSIPIDLIRPLLVLSIRAAHLHTIEDCRKLLKDVRKLSKRCSDAGGESLYYVHLYNVAAQRLHVLLAVQRKVRKMDPTAKAEDINISRWRVDVSTKGQYSSWFVSFKRGGLDQRRMEEYIRTVITEASDDWL